VTGGGRALRRGLLGTFKYQQILLGYRPQAYRGRVTFIINEKWNRRNFLMGWKRGLGGAVGVFEVPGTHENRLKNSGGMVGSIIRQAMKEENTVRESTGGTHG
jgi:hypothetical protein